MKFLAGFSSLEMCIPSGAGMSGYVARQTVEYGMHDPLLVQAAAFSADGEETVILLSLDLVGLEFTWLSRMERLVAEACSLSPDRILISCTHTHSGPAALHFFGMDPISLPFMEALCGWTVQCAKDALAHREPCRVDYGRGSCSISENRVLLQKWGGSRTTTWETTDWDHLGSGSYRPVAELLEQGYSPETFVDDEVLALRFAGTDQRTHGVIVNYACHPVCLEADNPLYSRDYIYYAAQRVREKVGDVPVLFLTGCAGDINPAQRGGFAESEYTGRRLGEAVCRALEEERDTIEPPQLLLETIPFLFHIKCDLDERVLQERQALYCRGREEAHAVGETITEKVYSAYLSWAEEMETLLGQGRLPRSGEVRLRILSFGAFAILALPFEAFHEIGRELKKMLGDGKTMVAAYTGGEFGYFVSETLAPYAKYEGMEAYKFSDWPGPIGVENGRKLLEAVKQHM